MESIYLEPTAITPEIDFNFNSGILKLKGRSIPENPSDFYVRILDWMKEYYKSPAGLSEIWFEMEYINSGSSRFILEILRNIKKYQEEGKKTIVKWYYEEEDEAILGLGEYYRDLIEMPIEFIRII
jgi:hypothetical protein